MLRVWISTHCDFHDYATALPTDSKFHVLSVLKRFMTSKEMLKALALPTENPKHDYSEKCWQEITWEWRG
jgi:hypothetical protein